MNSVVYISYNMIVARWLQDLLVYTIVLFLSLVESYTSRSQDRWDTVSGESQSLISLRKHDHAIQCILFSGIVFTEKKKTTTKKHTRHFLIFVQIDYRYTLTSASIKGQISLGSSSRGGIVKYRA